MRLGGIYNSVVLYVNFRIINKGKDLEIKIVSD